MKSNNSDWHDALAALAANMEPVQSDEQTAAEEEQTEKADHQAGTLHIALERKGRAGKTATIIFGFTIGEDTLKALASSLKSTLGCGGSVCGNEILIQGDRAEQVRRILREKGYKVS